MAAAPENLETCMNPPAEGWDARLPAEKRNWWFFFLGYSLVIGLVALAWFWVAPNHEIPNTTQAIEPVEFHAQVAEFVRKFETAPGSGVVYVPKGQDIYVEGHMWQWYPSLKLKAGETYRIWLSSVDVTHTFTIAEQRILIDAVPGHMYGITITPDTPGTYLLYCSEFCGLGHQNMSGRLIVEP
jgi:cytochrome c oxidase subunit II